MSGLSPLSEANVLGARISGFDPERTSLSYPLGKTAFDQSLSFIPILRRRRPKKFSPN